MARGLIAFFGAAVLAAGVLAAENETCEGDEETALLAHAARRIEREASEKSVKRKCPNLQNEWVGNNNCGWMRDTGDDCERNDGNTCRSGNPNCPCGYYPDQHNCPGASTCQCHWLPNDNCGNHDACANCCRERYNKPCGGPGPSPGKMCQDAVGGWDFDGTNIAKHQVQNAVQCKQHCEQNPSCIGYTFKRNPWGECWLKSTHEREYNNADSESGKCW